MLNLLRKLFCDLGDWLTKTFCLSMAATPGWRGWLARFLCRIGEFLVKRFCDRPGEPASKVSGVHEPGLNQGILYLWVAGNMDTYVNSQAPDMTHGDRYDLSVAYSSTGTERHSYVRFHLPNIPWPINVLEAMIQLFHNGTNGSTPAQSIGCIQENFDWRPLGMSGLKWSTPGRPNGGGANSHLIQLVPPRPLQGRWVGTARTDPTLRLEVEGLLQDAAVFNPSHKGYIFTSGQTGSDESFKSGNSTDRLATNMNGAPRLLIALALNGDPDAITWPDLPGETDLFLAEPVLMYRRRIASAWPPEWKVVTP